MKKLILVLGGVLLSGTSAFAADWKSVPEVRLSSNHEINCCLSGFTRTQVSSLNVGKSRNILKQESRSSSAKQKENCLLTLAENPSSGPSPGRGNPDDRGGPAGSR